MEYNREIKRDGGKPRLSLVPPSLIESVGKILTFGAEKYEPNGWKKAEPERYKDAMMRHLCAYLEDGDSVDFESGYPHLWHLACNVSFLIEFKRLENRGVENGTVADGSTPKAL